MKVYGPAPPEPFTVAEPVFVPKQLTLACDTTIIDGPPEVVIFATAVTVHPFASVTVTVLPPAAKFETPAVVPPLGVHEYVYAVVPPLAVTVAPPVLAPQPAAVVAEITALKAAVGCVIITVPVPVQRFASLIAIVYVPAAKPL